MPVYRLARGRFSGVEVPPAAAAAAAFRTAVAAAVVASVAAAAIRSATRCSISDARQSSPRASRSGLTNSLESDRGGCAGSGDLALSPSASLHLPLGSLSPPGGTCVPAAAIDIWVRNASFATKYLLVLTHQRHGLFPANLTFGARCFEQQVNAASPVFVHLGHRRCLAFAAHRDGTRVPTGSGRQMMGKQAHGLLQLCLSVVLPLLLYLCFESW